MISGEPWLTEWAAQLEAFWGVPLFEMYGSTQTTGATLLTCERGVLPGGDRGVLHNLDHRVHLEVLDPDTLEPVGVGERARRWSPTWSTPGSRASGSAPGTW